MRTLKSCSLSNVQICNIVLLTIITISSVQFSLSVMSNSLQPHGLQHARLPCPLLTPGACSNSSPSSWWCHPTISSSTWSTGEGNGKPLQHSCLENPINSMITMLYIIPPWHILIWNFVSFDLFHLLHPNYLFKVCSF